MTLPADPFDGGKQPNCPACGTVMRDVDGRYECGGCGWFQDVPWIERPDAADEQPGIRGG